MKYCFLLGLVFTASLANAQLKLNEIMAGDDFIGHQPEQISWSPDNQTVYFRWKHNGQMVAPFYQTDLSNSAPVLIENKKTVCKTTSGFISDIKGEHTYFQKNGNLYKWSSKGSKLILQKSTYFYVVKVLENNKLIINENNNLYLFEPNNGRYIQLTDFKKGVEPNSKNEPSYLENQQEELFEIVRLNKSRQSARKTFKEETKAPSIPEYYLGEKSLGWTKITSDLKHIIFRLDEYPTNENTHVENHITANGYTKSTNARSKVGGKNPTHELVVMDLKTSEFNTIDITELPNIFDKPMFLNDDSKSENPREVIFTDCWLSETNNCIVEIKAYDNKTRWITSLDLASGKLKVQNQQQDDAWIGGPGITGWNMVPGNIGWLHDNETFYFQSEKSGYSHLYTHNTQTNKTEQLTTGKFEIHEANLSKDGSKFYISANKKHPGNREFYHLDVKTKSWTPILTEDGNYEVSMSPDEKNLAIRYSYKNKPWELYLAPNKANAKMVQVTDSQSEKFKNYTWKTPEVITFKTEDGQDVYARIYRPKTDVKNGAAVQFVHGAGYLQNAHNWWSGYHREYMFNNLLCDLGYTVIDIDYRASKGYGRDFRTAIYQYMGGADLDDQLLGKKYLVENEGIDPNKVGIYGGSYGGFITIMGLLTHPDEFKCGAAVRSVTDWAHYSHEYTSNILNTPELDSLAFKQSSPIYYADGLKNKLLILHGMVDDNVQFQDVVRLNQRFIELGKTNFEMALYPIEPHGFKETSSWVDEYTRILNLFNEELLNK
jgi:dipeptidyl aminopeptidase/acylaminoacyl peptidase